MSNEHARKVPSTATKIARKDQFPPRFLYRVLRRLVDAGILTGVSGPGGGYALAKAPEKISLAEIVEAVEGPQDATVLEPVAAFHAAAIRQINGLCEKNAVAFRRACAVHRSSNSVRRDPLKRQAPQLEAQVSPLTPSGASGYSRVPLAACQPVS